MLFTWGCPEYSYYFPSPHRNAGNTRLLVLVGATLRHLMTMMTLTTPKGGMKRKQEMPKSRATVGCPNIRHVHSRQANLATLLGALNLLWLQTPKRQGLVASSTVGWGYVKLIMMQ